MPHRVAQTWLQLLICSLPRVCLKVSRHGVPRPGLFYAVCHVKVQSARYHGEVFQYAAYSKLRALETKTPTVKMYLPEEGNQCSLRKSHKCQAILPGT